MVMDDFDIKTALYMMEISPLLKEMVLVFSGSLMVIIMKVNGKMIILKDLEFIFKVR